MRAVAGVKQSLLLRIQTVRGRVGAIAPVRWLVSALSVVLVVIAATFVGTNLVTADSAPGASPITVTFNYNGATGGTSVTSATVTPGVSADSVLPFPTKSGLDFSGWFNTQSLLNGQRITTIGEGDTGELLAGFVPPELAATLNLDPPVPPPTCAGGYAVACSLGETGPGGGLIFLISGGKAYEMAPKNWGVSGAIDPTAKWITNAAKCYTSGSSTADQNCQTNNLYPGTSDAQTASTIASEAIGMGSANTDAIIARMVAGSVSPSDYAAGLTSAYAGGGYSDWFLPSKDELNAMCNYSRNPTSPAAPGVRCRNAQNAAFTSGEFVAYGFASANYWSSSQDAAVDAWYQNFGFGERYTGSKANGSLSVRPVRAF